MSTLGLRVHTIKLPSEYRRREKRVAKWPTSDSLVRRPLSCIQKLEERFMMSPLRSSTGQSSFRGLAVVAVLGLSGLLLQTGCSKQDDKKKNGGPGPAGGPAPVSTELKKFQELKGKIDIAGGTAHIEIMNEAAKRISGANPDIRITVAGGGSGVGVKKLGEGLVEIGNTGRALTAKEKETYGLVTFPFALDGVSII